MKRTGGQPQWRDKVGPRGSRNGEPRYHAPEGGDSSSVRLCKPWGRHSTISRAPACRVAGLQGLYLGYPDLPPGGSPAWDSLGPLPADRDRVRQAVTTEPDPVSGWAEVGQAGGDLVENLASLGKLSGKPISAVPECARRIRAILTLIVDAFLVWAAHEAVRHDD